eukprot:403344471
MKCAQRKDIIRYFSLICDRLRKKYKPLEDKRRVCLAVFKGGDIQTLSTTQLLDIVKHKLNQLTSLHFFKDNTQPINIDSYFQYYMFALNFDEEKLAKDPPVNLIQPIPYQKQGKGQGLNNLIRGFGLDKGEYNYHLVQVTQHSNGSVETNDVWDQTMRYKSYNYVSNLLYILEKKDKMLVERMNVYFLLDNAAQIFMFDIDKCLVQQPKKVKSEKDEAHFIDGMKPEFSLLPPTFNVIQKTLLQIEEDQERKKKLLKLRAQEPKQENFILKNIKKLRIQGGTQSQASLLEQAQSANQLTSDNKIPGLISQKYQQNLQNNFSNTITHHHTQHNKNLSNLTVNSNLILSKGGSTPQNLISDQGKRYYKIFAEWWQVLTIKNILDKQQPQTYVSRARCKKSAILITQQNQKYFTKFWNQQLISTILQFLKQ